MRLFSLFAALVILTAGFEPALAQVVSDDKIHDEVLQKLATDRDVKGGGIDVEVKDGVVTLTGKVREEKAKLKAERIVKKVKGVKSVVNQLKTEMPVGQPAAPPK